MPRPEPVETPLPDVVGNSPAMRKVYRDLRRAAPTRANVLLIGETGTGKEVIARAVHQLSRRSDGPYIRVNCGALHESLLESELFGHVKGAFTGAIDNKTGRFEAAHGGTIFLDEISSMSFRLQVKLLRVLQEKEFERVGESRTIKVDVRVIAATNQALEEEIAAGRFREDLYYRLNVVPILLPPLRERREDVPLLAQYFLKRYCDREGRRDVPELPPDLQKLMADYDWPGNVRQLENYIERLVVLTEGPVQAEQVPPPGHAERLLRSVGRSRGAPTDVPGLIDQLVRVGIQTLPDKLHERLVDAVERELIEQVMKQCRNVGVKAAARLGINRNTLHKKLEDYERQDTAGGGPEANGPASA
jgi:Nif-specific regulatory protein